jgi:hypothetical protein
MYFEIYFVATEFRRKMLATAEPFAWLSTVDHKRIAASVFMKRKSGISFFISTVAKFTLDIGTICWLSSLRG